MERKVRIFSEISESPPQAEPKLEVKLPKLSEVCEAPKPPSPKVTFEDTEKF